MPATPESKWPIERFRVTDDAHLHALGQMTLMYNFLEESLSWLFIDNFPSNAEYAESLFYRLNNRQRVDMIREVIAEAEDEKLTKERMLYGLRAFDICTDNRNILSHATAEPDQPTKSILKLSKRSSKDISQLIYFDVKLIDLRRVADETATTFLFLIMLNEYMRDRQLLRKGERVERPAALPDIPPQPRKLIPSQPPKVDGDA